MKTDFGEVTIRNATEDDVGQILAIDEMVFSTIWSPNFLRQQLRSEKCFHRVLDKSGKAIGHSGLMRLHDEGHRAWKHPRKPISKKAIAVVLQNRSILGE